MTLTLCRAVSVATLVAALGVAMPAQAQAPAVDTRIGSIPLQFGLPADAATVGKLYDEMDFQRASQAYLWALPIVGFAGWQDAHRSVFGARDIDMVVYESVKDKLGILTANATTPYIVGMPDLSKTGPLVIDYPAGATAGGVGDFWQRPVTDMGETGPDKGKGGKYLIVGPGQTEPKDKNYRIVRSPTVNIFFAFRVLDPDPAKAKDLISRVRLYPYAERAKPEPDPHCASRRPGLDASPAEGHRILGASERHSPARAGDGAGSLLHGNAEAAWYRERQGVQPGRPAEKAS